MTTDQSAYQVGQPIEMTFTETNTGDQPLTVAVTPTDFSVSQNNAVIWQSDPANAGRPPAARETLLPGQSVSQTANWDGTETYAFTSFEDSSQSSQVNAFGTFVVSNPSAPDGLTATFQITDPIVSTVTTDQSVYQLGEPVQLTYTEVNTSDQSITIPHPQPSGFGITHNGTPVLIDLLPAIFIFGTETIAPGQVFTMSQAWNGIPMSGPSAPGDLTGTFVVDYGPGANDTVATTTFEIVAPPPDELVTSVTTDQATYQAGQPVNMTFTETNVGDQPIAVLTGSTEFEITQNTTASFGGIFNPGGPTPIQVWEGPSSFNVTQNGAEVWNSLVPDLSPYIWDLGNYSWATLQPGQSYTQMATWNGVPDQLPSGDLSGTFTVSNEDDPRADTATFQMLDPNGSSATVQIVPTPYETPSDPPTPNPTPRSLPPSNPPPSNPSAQPPNGPSVPPIAVTLSTAPTYKLGQSVPLSLILKDVSLSKVAINECRHIETVTVQHGSTLVYESARKVHPLTLRMIRSGHPLKLKTLWSGKPNQVGVKKLVPGAYTITVDDDGYAASTTVDLLQKSRL